MLWLLSAVIGNQAEMILDDRISDATIEEKREFCVGTTSRVREGRSEQAGTHPGRTRRAGYQGRAKRVWREAPQPPRKRRLGGWYPRVPLGDGGAVRVWHAARGDLARHTVLASSR